MSSLAEIQRSVSPPDESVFTPERQLHGPALDRFVNRHGRAFVVLHEHDGRAHVERSFYLRRESVFWLPPPIVREHPDAQPEVAVVFVDEASSGFALVIIKGDADVDDDEHPGWLRVRVRSVASHVTEGFRF